MKPLLLIAALIALTGCAQFRTRQTDVSYENGKIVREVTTKASAITLLDAKSQLTNFRASQTDKTQSANVGALSQDSSSTNAASTINAVVNLINAVK